MGGNLYRAVPFGYPVPNDARGFYGSVVAEVTTHQNLVFYDYETLEQCYVCDIPNCTHNNEGCTSYLDTYGGVSTFAYGENLFINYALYNNGTEDRNNWPSAIEKRDLDGTNPQVMITYPPCELQVDKVFTDGEWLYYRDADGFVRLNIDTFEKQLVATIPKMTSRISDGGYEIPESFMELMPCSFEGKFLWQRLNKDDTIDLLLMVPATGSTSILHTWPSTQNKAYAYHSLPHNYTLDGKGYYVDVEKGEIRCFDIASGEDTLVTDKYASENIPYSVEYAEDDGSS